MNIRARSASFAFPPHINGMKIPQADWGTQTSTSNANLNSTDTQNNSSSWTGSFDGQTTVQQGATCADTPARNWGH